MSNVFMDKALWWLRASVGGTWMTIVLGVITLIMASTPALAAGAGAPHLPSDSLGLIWIVPFIGILFSIALFPLFAHHFWEQHYGKISLFWSLSLLLPMLVLHGFSTTLYELLHTYLLEYIPFIILLFALFSITGGIAITGTMMGTPALNTAILVIGTLIASWMGTTGAAMLLIRPLLRANSGRKNKVHLVVFFIFLVANIGGSLTPLGDPPLFLGFLKGVDFFWTTQHTFLPYLLLSCLLIALFYLIDVTLYKREVASGHEAFSHLEKGVPIAIKGRINLLLLLGVIGAVLMSGSWDSGITLTVYHVDITLQALARDVLLIVIALLSLKFTPRPTRALNDFNWEPILEVAKLFAGIFITIIPAIRILSSGAEGAMGAVVNLVSNPDGSANDMMYFWVTGLLSAFLDNAPTYLVFFNTAGGDAPRLMAEVTTLLAISAGAVFMGAMTYIGNAPNFMVRSIAESQGVKMPSFFGYMLWSSCILLPCFLLITVMFFV